VEVQHYYFCNLLSACALPVVSHRKNLALTAQEAGWAPGSVWMGAENLTSMISNPKPSSPY